METYEPGVGISAGSLMLKWNLIDRELQNQILKIEPGDHVNVFINFECILKNLFLYKGLNSAVEFHKQRIVIELESAILNLMANYRMYFTKLKCIPHLYFYYTDLQDNSQQMKMYNKYYRDYYQHLYGQNPTFRNVGRLMMEVIIPEITLILSYVPRGYFINAKSFDGSLIPQVISTFSNSKNVIVSSDIFDTLYMFNPNFIVLYLKRRFQHFNLTSDIQSTVQTIVKDESPFDLTIFNSELYYRLLLSIKGSKIRNIRSAKGFGYGKFMKLLKEGIENDIVLRDFQSIDSILQLFPEKYQSDIKHAFQCTGIDTQYELLSDANIDQVRSQIIDRSDMESLEALNNRRFLDSPINLPGLLG